MKDELGYRAVDLTPEKLNRLTSSNEFISRYVYVFLRSLEYIINNFEDFVQASADTAPRKKNGDVYPNRPTRFRKFLIKELDLANIGFTSFINSVTEKENRIKIVCEGQIEI